MKTHRIITGKAFIVIGAALLTLISGKVVAQGTIQPVPVGNYAIGPDYFDEKKEREIMLNDGLPAGVVDKLIEDRKEFFKNYKDVHKDGHDVSVLKDKGGVLPVPLNCSDLGFENGWSTWYGAPGKTNGTTGIPTLSAAVTPPPVATNTTSFCFTLNTGGVDDCTPGTDPITGLPGPPIPMVAPGFGNTSLKLGCHKRTGCWVEQATYTFVPTAQDTNLVYAYAVVLNDPGSSHSPTQRPFAEFMILAPNGDTIPCSYQKYVASGGQGPLPGFYTTNTSCGSNTSYKPWTTVGVNLKQYVGTPLTIVITNVDCAQCGHYGHSYWDFMCGPVPLAAGCLGNQSTISGPNSTPQTPYTYQWYQNGVGMPGETNQDLVVTPQLGDTFAVQVIQPSGCNFYLTYVPAIAFPNFNFNGACGDYTFTDSSIIQPLGSANIVSWNWSFPGGSPATASTSTVNVTYPPGTYTASLSITSSNGCSATIDTVLTVGGFPTAAATPSTPCLGTATTLTDGSIGLPGDPVASWEWLMPGGNPSTANTQNTSTLYSTAGSHSVTLMISTQNGCKDTIVQQVIVYTPPVANFQAPDSGCAPVCLNYSDLSTSTDGNITGWEWTFPGGSPVSANGTPNPSTVCYAGAGTYSTTLIATTQYGCKDTITLPMVEVFPWPNADFCVVPNQAPATAPVFQFCDMWSSDVVAWSWNFGDNTGDSTSTDPSHSYESIVTENDFYAFQICIRVQNQHGCWDTTCKTVELIPEFEFYIPNTFTPNGDWVNELFYGKSRGVKEYNIWIFDRWGNQIWDCHKTDKNTNWDSDATLPKQEGLSSACKWDGVVVQGGMDMNGNSRQFAQEDVYVWKVRLTDVFNKKHTYVGHVNVVR